MTGSQWAHIALITAKMAGRGIPQVAIATALAEAGLQGYDQIREALKAQGATDEDFAAMEQTLNEIITRRQG